MKCFHVAEGVRGRLGVQWEKSGTFMAATASLCVEQRQVHVFSHHAASRQAHKACKGGLGYAFRLEEET